MFVCSCLFYQQIHSQHQVNLFYLEQSCEHVPKTRACSRLFPIVDLRYVFTRFKAEKVPSISALVAFESKSNLKIFPTSLIKKLVFCYVSCNFLIMVLITIVPLSLNSNKLDNNVNCDTNLLMPMSLLLISSKKLRLLGYY